MVLKRKASSSFLVFERDLVWFCLVIGIQALGGSRCCFEFDNGVESHVKSEISLIVLSETAMGKSFESCVLSAGFTVTATTMASVVLSISFTLPATTMASVELS